jgi:serine/threonine-protein kinase
LELEPGVVVAQRYKILRPLGRGGMGEVFAAENVRTGRVVAVKVLRADSKQKSSAVARFQREARAAGAINSDHVTQVLDVQDDPEQGIVIVFELLEGESLIDRLKRTGPMSFDELFPIVEQVWMGLDAAHAAGVIHRDLKPSNVFIVHGDDPDEEIAKVFDFGIAKVERPAGSAPATGVTRAGTLLGTPGYMSPEQARGATIDHRTDLYALGVLACEAATGRVPFESDDLGDILRAAVLGELVRPSSLGAVPPGFDAWFARSTALEPAARFSSAKEQAAALHEVLAVA